VEPKLGKLPAVYDRRTLKLANFIEIDKLPLIPEEIIWSKMITQWPMMRNDEIGDCGIAGAGHLIQTWSANESREIILSDDAVVDAYSLICGYDKQSGDNDNGCILLNILNHWRTDGISGHRIEGFVSVNFLDQKEIMAALYLFGPVYIGLQLPLFAQINPEWTFPPQVEGPDVPGSWGGHCVIAVDATPDYLSVVSWGKIIKMNWAFFRKYCDESYAVFSPDDWATDGTAPNGFKIDQLRENLKHL
jgi:hypothetical protein